MSIFLSNNQACKPEKHEELQPTYRNIGDFFFPIALQAILQSFTYPLVAIVAARGKGASLNIAALAQAHVLLFFLLSFCAGLLTTGMVYCVNRNGLKRFRILNKSFTFFVFFIHAFCCIPFVANIIFSSIMGLSNELYEATYLAFLLSLPFPLLFNLRNVSMVVLFNKKLTGKAFSASFARILLTIAISVILTSFGLTGIVWAAFCQTIPIIFEILLINHFAKEQIAELEKTNGHCPSLSEMTTFTMSFSAGKVLMAFSSYAVAAFAARAPNPEIMLPVYYATIGLTNPVAFAASRIQATVIAFAVPKIKNFKLFNFTAVAGLICGLAPLIFIVPFLANWYYGSLQKIPTENLIYVKQAATLLVFVPFSVALRSYMEGWAAFSRKSLAVITGQGVYLGVVVSTAFFTFSLGTQGHLIGPISLFIGNICTAAILILALKIKEPQGLKQPPSPFITPI